MLQRAPCLPDKASRVKRSGRQKAVHLGDKIWTGMENLSGQRDHMHTSPDYNNKSQFRKTVNEAHMKSITHHTEENRNKRRFIRIINIGIITILIMLLVHGFNTTYAEFSCSALTESNQTIERQDELFGVKNEEGNWIILPQWSSIRTNGEGT